MNQKHCEALQELREQGYAVAIFSPSELEGAPADQVENIMVSRGWNAISDLKDDKDESSDE